MAFSSGTSPSKFGPVPPTPHPGMQRLDVIHPTAVVLGERTDERYELYKEWDIKQRAQLEDAIAPPPLTEFLKTMQTVPTFSVDEVSMLERATRGQGDNPKWLEQRKGRCTASMSKDICTRMDSVDKDPSADPSSLGIRMLGSKPTPDIPALKYGRRMGPLAVTKYTEIQRRHGAKLQWNLSVTTTSIIKSITCDLFSNVFQWRLKVPFYSC